MAIIEIVINLYALDNLRRSDFSHYEPLRMFFGGPACAFGPMLGVLSEKLDPAAPFALSALAFFVVGVFAWGASRLKTREQDRSPNPIKLVPRFFSQPRMRLAYSLAVGRSAWWTIFFVFAPMLVVTLGYSKITAATVITISTCFMLTPPFWGWAARRFGTRHLLIGGFALCAVFSGLAGVLADPLVAIGCLVLASIALCSFDGVGNVLFLRAVRPLERTEMAAVYQTWRDVGQGFPQLAIAGLLLYTSIGSVFVASAIAMMALAGLASYVPRRM